MARTRPMWLLLAPAHVYTILVFVWAVFHFIFGDRWAWLFILNAFAPYLFAPVPILLLIAIVVRGRELWIELFALFVLGVFLFGEFFIPQSISAHSDNPQITVMTYNVLDLGIECSAIVSKIRSSNADVVAIQELNPETAGLIRQKLIDEYPYQVLDPREETRGMGILSRLPMRSTGESLSENGVGKPQIVTVDWGGTTIVVMNVHPMPTNFSLQDFFVDSAYVEWTIQERERDVQTITNFASAQSMPVLVLGDLNLPDQSQAYQIVTQKLDDSWRGAGWGFGHTFPAPDPDGNSRIHVAGLPLPTWLVRIDYIFHSRQWHVLSSKLGAWDGYSDHRPVISELTLNEFFVK